MKRISSWLAVAALAGLVLTSTPVRAEVRLPHVFGSHMVLQRDQELPVWGWADPGEVVKVQLADLPAAVTRANRDGQWRVTLPPLTAGGPVQLTVSASNRVVLEDILVGEVWVCSGQSNMAMTVASCNNATEEIAQGDHPRLRHVRVPNVPSGFPADDFTADWQVCSPQTVGGFTAAGYYFGRHLLEELEVPIGLINTSWGGTAIEPWTPPIGFAQVPSLDAIYRRVKLTDPRYPSYKRALRQYLTETEAWQAAAREALRLQQPLEPAPAYPDSLRPLEGPGGASTLYNGMVHPLLPFAIRGAIWYQGEANRRDGALYTDKMQALISGWRTQWNQGDFPFYFVQIAPYVYGEEDPYYVPTFWEAQAAAQAIPNTGMAVITDVGDLNDIHPRNKQDVGKRLAFWALNRTYGRPDVVCEGPAFKSLTIEGGKLRVKFTNTAGGLISRDGQPLTWFEIIGADTDFEPAVAAIEGETVVLSAKTVKQPVAMRFGWHRNAEPNLANKAGLPATAFRAGEVPTRDYLTLKVAEAKQYELVYDLDLAKAGPDIKYDLDYRSRLTRPFDRVAYFLELQKPGQALQYVYVSMDAFTADLGKIGVPTVASGANFQTRVANMTVVSNVDGIATGTGMAGGNIEFWPNNYGGPNAAGIPNASSELWDFGDAPGPPEDGYGCMQVHNFAARQTIFAFNTWKSGASADLGIGNSEGETRDWTFTRNAASYSLKRLRVLVRPTR